MSTNQDLNARVTPAPKYHPIWGLNYRLKIDGKLYTYSAFLDAWEGPEFCDPLTGEEIHRRTWESPVRLEVAS